MTDIKKFRPDPDLKLVEQVRQIHEKDLADGHGEVYISHALERKLTSS